MPECARALFAWQEKPPDGQHRPANSNYNTKNRQVLQRFRARIAPPQNITVQKDGKRAPCVRDGFKYFPARIR